jgi:hypothetical protein
VASGAFRPATGRSGSGDYSAGYVHVIGLSNKGLSAKNGKIFPVLFFLPTGPYSSRARFEAATPAAT